MRRFLVSVVLLSISIGVVWRIVTMEASPKNGIAGRGQVPIAVECAKAIQGDIDDVAIFTGTLAGIAEVQISPKIAGRIESIRVNLGDEVRQGQLLATLDDSEARHAVTEAQAKLAVARASLEECLTNLETARRELERVRTLRERKVAAASELEAAESEVSALEARKRFAEANILQQEAALRVAEARLSYTQITAPISGFVGKRFFDEGTMISASTPILSLADIRTVKTVIHVVEQDYAKIRPNLKAYLTVDAYPDREFEGHVSRIAPVLDLDTRTAEVEIEIPNPDLLLKPGMFTRVRIHFSTHQGVTLIPNRALVKRETKQGVFVPTANNKQARFVEVKVGISAKNLAEVTGIQPGQDIIVLGQHLLNDGDPIILSATPEIGSF